jgi:hypothetical protein
MAETFGVVLFVVVGVAAVIAVATLAGARRSYNEIGKGGMSLRDGNDRPDDEVAGFGGSASAVRAEEIRQLMEARNARRERRGEPPLDVAAEIARLEGPKVDPGLRAEIHDLVVARNARLLRAGKPPLDVDAEVARRIADLDQA